MKCCLRRRLPAFPLAEGMGPEDKSEGEAAVKSFLAKRLESDSGGERRVLADAFNDDKRCSFSFWVDTVCNPLLWAHSVGLTIT